MRTRALNMVIAFVIAVSGNCFAGIIESANQVKGNGITPAIRGLSYKPISKKISLAYFFLVKQKYAEAYVGASYKILPVLALDAYIGLEQADNPLRLAGSAFVNHKSFVSLSILEYGGSGWWYHHRLVYTYKIVGLGLMLERFTGLGPRLELNIPSFTRFKQVIPISIIWISPLYDFEAEENAKGVMFGFMTLM